MFFAAQLGENTGNRTVPMVGLESTLVANQSPFPGGLAQIREDKELTLERLRPKKWIALLIFGCAANLGLIGQAQFETRGNFPIQESPGTIAVGDFNHDGKLDLAVAAFYTGKVAVLLGKGDGTFQPANYYTISSQIESVTSVATADLRKNGTLDLVVADYLDGNVSILLGNGDGTFQTPRPYSTAPYFPGGVAVGNFGGSYPDLVLIDFPAAIGVMIGNGDGTFQPQITMPLTYDPAGVGIGDFNHDGKQDLAVAEHFGGINEVAIFVGNGDGSFSVGDTYAVNPEPGSIAVADLRGSGELDLAVADFQGAAISVLLGNGNGTFELPVSYAASFPVAVVAADVNGDGKPDLVVAGQGAFSYDPATVSVLLGNGDGTFQPGESYPIGKESSSVAVGDFNGDHKPDIVVSDARDNAVVSLLNTGIVSFSPVSPVTFADQLVNTTSSAQGATMTNNGTSGLSISSITSTGQFSAKSDCGSSLAPGAQCRITATFSPKTEGTKTGTISIVDTASSKPQVIELTGAGTVVQFIPTSLTFASQKVGTKSAPKQVQVTNIGSNTLTVSKILIGGDLRNFSQTNTCGTGIGGGATCAIAVTFAPIKPGALNATMYIYDTGGGSPQKVPLTGTGD